MARQLTNSELGDRIGVSPSMASRLRNGHRLPSAQVMDNIHHQLHVPLEDLMAAHREGPVAFGKLIRRALGQRTAPL